MSRARDRSGRMPPSRSGYEDALALLARRDHSARELSTKLARRGHSGEASAAAIERLREQHYQSDGRFAENLARHRAGQGYGPVRIRAELKTHALSDSEIRAALDAIEVDWAASAAAQWRRQTGKKPPRDAAGRAKAAAFLLRRGFDAATVRAVTRIETGGSDEELG